MIRFIATLIAVCATVGLGSAGATPRTAPSAAEGPVFSGSDDRTLPPFTVSVPSTLRWTTNGPLFMITPEDLFGGGVISSARSGATFLSAGTHRLKLDAYGSWTVRIVKGVERPQPLGDGLVGFRGNGARELPPFSTERRINLVWTNSGTLFVLYSGSFTKPIKSQAKRGKRFMPAGLHEFKISAVGSWTIAWKP